MQMQGILLKVEHSFSERLDACIEVAFRRANLARAGK